MIGVQIDMLSILGTRAESRKDRLFRLNIQRGSGFEGGKGRIREALREYARDFPKCCEYVKKEYGTGGFSGADDSFCDFDSKGFKIRDYTQRYDDLKTGEINKCVEWLYTWPEVVKKIIELIVMDEY